MTTETSRNPNVDLDPEIWVDQEKTRAPEGHEEVLDDDELFDAVADNDIRKFCELICDEDIDEAMAQELFIIARRELENPDDGGIVNEALTLSQRRARGRVMKRMRSRLKVARRMAARRRANPEKLKNRATKAARAAIKKRLAAQRDYKSLTPSEKQQVDRRMERVSKNVIDRMTRRLLPQVRKKEAERMAKRSSANAQRNESFDAGPDEVYSLAESMILDLQEKGVCDLITMRQIKSFEKVVDALFSKFKMDFNFTKHFAERMSDRRNDPCISLEDLANFIKKIYFKAKSGKNSLSDHKDVEVVLKDLQQSLNIPVAIEYDRKSDELKVVAKTIMRKKNFSTPNKVVKY